MPNSRRNMGRKNTKRSSPAQALKGIRLFATDVDGVLTDAGMYYSESGDELKKFNTQDGMGIKLLQRAGLVTALVTQENTKLVARRGEKLAIPEVHQGVMDKLPVLRDMAARHGMTLAEVAYMGDDILDLDSMKHAILRACPADSAVEVKSIANYISPRQGGDACVRDLIELVLKVQNRW